MKNNKLIILSSFLFLILASSCTTTDDSTAYYAKWKLENETYYSNMKDSVGYAISYIPLYRGGSSYYYKIKKQGNQTGKSPLTTDYVTVNYRGKMINGIVFDKTYSTLLPDSTAKSLTFSASNLVQGWTENLIKMKAGEIRTIVIPQELGYGTRTGGAIPPFSTLIFDIQLISFKATN